MAENKKASPKATVTITIGEYKELITEAVANRKDAEKYASETYDLKQKLKDAEQVLFNLNKEIPKLTNEMARLEVELAYYKKGDTENERT